LPPPPSLRLLKSAGSVYTMNRSVGIDKFTVAVLVTIAAIANALSPIPPRSPTPPLPPPLSPPPSPSSPPSTPPSTSPSPPPRVWWWVPPPPSPPPPSSPPSPPPAPFSAAQLATVRETARPLSPAGVLAKMPWSPVYAGDDFTVDVYAHTGGFPLSSWRVVVDIRTDALSYVGHTNLNSLFNGIIVHTYRLSDTHTRLGFISTNLIGTTGAAVPMLRLRLRAAAGLGMGRHSGLLSLMASLFVNTGGFGYAENDVGVVLDPTTGLAGAAHGSLEVMSAPPPLPPRHFCPPHRPHPHWRRRFGGGCRRRRHHRRPRCHHRSTAPRSWQRCARRRGPMRRRGSWSRCLRRPSTRATPSRLTSTPTPAASPSSRGI